MSVLLPIAAPGLEFELGIAKSWAAKSLHRSKPLQDVVVEGGGLRDVLRAPVVPWFQTLYGHMGAISETHGNSGTLQGLPQIWKGSIAYHGFAQKLCMANLGGIAGRKI